MKKTLLFLLLLFSGLLDATAQNSLPPVYNLETDTTQWQNIPVNYRQVLEDKSGKLTFAQVISTEVQNQFHDTSVAVDSTSKSYWFRYRIKNLLNRAANIGLNSQCEYDDFWVQKNGGWDQFSSGTFQDWAKKDGLKMINIIPLEIQPGEELTIYQRTSNNNTGLPSDFTIAIVNPEKFVQNSYINYVEQRVDIFSLPIILECFYIGILLILAIFIFLFFRVIRQQSYLYFSMFVLLLSLNRITNPLIVYLHWYYPAYAFIAGFFTLFWAGSQFFLFQFVRHFFEVKKNSPGWDRFLWFTSLFVLVIQAIRSYYLIIPDNTDGGIGSIVLTPGYNYMAVFIPLFITLFLLVAKRANISFYKIIIAGSFPYFAWRSGESIFDFVHYFLSKKQIWDSMSLTNYTWSRTFEIATMLWFVLSFSYILFLHLIELKKENAQRLLDNERIVREKEIERNQLIAQQKIQLEKDVDERTAELNQSLREIKSTQAQLIQSEKMASLGELTAGIAHEIQNPLNFVNNFSEVNTELIDELELEFDKGNLDEVKAIAKDIRENEQKILHHGKRADAIVKGMLQHSRNSSGVKEPTDINALADEYLRLAYHGLRAKAKSFNATLNTDFDESIGKIDIISQDIGRVILNLITNAFYAVDEKKKQQSEGYKPTVTVTTKKSGDKVLISVKDNGNGIPQKVFDKIFQPFFTTKPTGEGTGLGLSLAYDIVKAHGGELKVETKEGGGSEFIIQLPIRENI